MAEQLPPIAWEQAVFVCLFIVLVAGVLAWNERQSKAIQRWIEKRDEAWMGFLDRQSKADDSQRCEDRDQMRDMAAAITKLTEAFGIHRQEFLSHVADEDARFSVLLTDTQKRKVKDKREQAPG